VQRCKEMLVEAVGLPELMTAMSRIIKMGRWAQLSRIDDQAS